MGVPMFLQGLAVNEAVAVTNGAGAVSEGGALFSQSGQLCVAVDGTPVVLSPDGVAFDVLGRCCVCTAGATVTGSAGPFALDAVGRLLVANGGTAAPGYWGGIPVTAAGALPVTGLGPPPVNTVLPVVTQTAGTSVLSVTTGGWTNSPIGYSYQWRRNGVDVAGANAATYTIPDTDASTVWDCRVTATNAFGSTTATAAAIFVGMLDRVSAAVASALAVRRLRAGYTGPLIRVRRSSDNAQLDIGSAFAIEPNIVTNGTFATDTFWTKGTGVTISGGVANCSGAAQIITANIGMIPGRRYAVQFAYTCTSGAALRVNNSLVNDANVKYTQPVPNGTSGTIRCDFVADNSLFAIEAHNATFTGTIDNVVVNPVLAVGDALDTAALLAFAGSGSAFVVTQYAQNAGGINVTQASAALQPRIVNAGVLDTRNGVPSIEYLEGQTLTAASAVSAAAAASVAAYGIPAAGTQCIYGAGGNNISALLFNANSERRVGRADTAATMTAFTDPSQYDGALAVYYDATNADTSETSRRNNSDLGILLVGVAVGSFPSVLTIGSRLVGGTSPLYMRGGFPELVLFTNELPLATAQAISRQQGAYYGVVVS